MKHIVSSLLISGIVSTLAFAQMQTHTPPTPAQMAQRRVQGLTNFLGLNASQQQQATTIFTTSATANATVEASLKTEHQSLDTAIQSNNAASIGQIATAIGGLTAQLTANNATADAQFYQILTADQQTKFSKSLGRGFGPMGGGFGHGRPQQ